MGWRQTPTPQLLFDGLVSLGADVVKTYENGSLHALVAHEPFEGLDGPRLWHMSIAHPDRYPTWDEQRDARYELLPDDMTFASYLPPKSEYVALHDNCFHWWEVAPLINHTPD